MKAFALGLACLLAVTSDGAHAEYHQCVRPSGVTFQTYSACTVVAADARDVTGGSGSTSSTASHFSSASSSSQTSTSHSGYIRGPKGGCYTIGASGKKRYVDRSMCN